MIVINNIDNYVINDNIDNKKQDHVNNDENDNNKLKLIIK